MHIMSWSCGWWHVVQRGFETTILALEIEPFEIISDAHHFQGARTPAGSESCGHHGATVSLMSSPERLELELWLVACCLTGF